MEDFSRPDKSWGSSSDTCSEKSSSSSFSSVTSNSVSPDIYNYFHENNDFGWFDAVPDEHEQELEHENIRNAWSDHVHEILKSKSEPLLTREVSFRAPPQNRTSENPKILFTWINPNASISMKMSDSEPILNQKINSSSSNFGISISSSVNGFRIRQHASGEINAEFNYIFCYGSRSYSSWKPYSDFKNLANILFKIQSETSYFVKSDFKESIKAWKFLEGKKKWFKSLSVKYLIEKSIYLGRFMEAFLLECPSPGLILCFLNSEQLLPSALSFTQNL